MIATGNTEDALDIVQEAMMKLAQSYANKAPDEWPPLFHRILQSKILDFYRRRKVRQQWQRFFPVKVDENENNPVEEAPDLSHSQPDDKLDQHRAMHSLEQALQQLPLRQQQAFLLRVWEGMDVAETAASMGCSTGSVKTHYSRAIHTLRELLGEFK